MNYYVTLFILAFTLPSWAQSGKILECLGHEEKRFHFKKEQGPIYDLNQKLIGELVQIPNVEIRAEEYREVCQRNNFSESWKLLELSIKKGKEIFILPKNVQGMQRQMAMGMIEDFVDASKEIFLNFISQIQSASPTLNCLKDEIPELDAFFTEVKYLQEDVELKVIFKNKDQRIFGKLKNYPEAFKKCQSRKASPKSS